jgi:hypothetical protein
VIAEPGLVPRSPVRLVLPVVVTVVPPKTAKVAAAPRLTTAWAWAVSVEPATELREMAARERSDVVFMGWALVGKWAKQAGVSAPYGGMKIAATVRKQYGVGTYHRARGGRGRTGPRAGVCQVGFVFEYDGQVFARQGGFGCERGGVICGESGHAERG